jgi:hypothetical protein
VYRRNCLPIGYIDRVQLKMLAQEMANNEYGQYLMAIVQGEVEIAYDGQFF